LNSSPTVSVDTALAPYAPYAKAEKEDDEEVLFDIGVVFIVAVDISDNDLNDDFGVDDEVDDEVDDSSMDVVAIEFVFAADAHAASNSFALSSTI
jgi:hypothetical protein